MTDTRLLDGAEPSAWEAEAARDEAEQPLRAALRAIQETGREATWQEQLGAAKCSALMVGYHHKYKDAGWRSVSVEEEFELPIINPETSKPSRTYTQAGKTDGIVARDGKLYLRENKTCAEDITDPNSTYWRRMAIDSQVSSYMLANWQNERKLDGTLYDVVRKPSIRPKQIPNNERAKIAAFGEYCGRSVPDYEKQAIIDGSKEESLLLYRLRLEQDVTARPDFYYARRMVPRLDGELLEWAGELWDAAKDISIAKQLNRHYRNSDACMQFGSPCIFLGLCSGHDSTDSEKWERAGYVHDELTPRESAEGGRYVLTHSRIRTFQSCRKKHFYRYELGLRRTDEEEREARWFGSLWHAALTAWWSCFPALE